MSKIRLGSMVAFYPIRALVVDSYGYEPGCLDQEEYYVGLVVEGPMTVSVRMGLPTRFDANQQRAWKILTSEGIFFLCVDAENEEDCVDYDLLKE